MTFDFSSSTPSALRRAIDDFHRLPEERCLTALLAHAGLGQDLLARVRSNAEQLVAAVRARRTRAGGVDALMRQFTLSSEEGVALMCLAEALLRIPDAATRDALIRDKIGGGDWRAHVGRSPSLFVNATAWGLLVTGKLVTTHSDTTLGTALARMLARGGEPLIRAAVDLAMRMLGRQFVTGETIEDALEQSARPCERGYRYSYDMLGEAAMTEADAQRYLGAYEHAIECIGNSAECLVHPFDQRWRLGPGISIKLSALHPRYSRSQRRRVHDELLPRVRSLALRARAVGIGLNIDAEESERLGISLELLEALASDPQLADYRGLGFVVQAYQKRAPAVIEWIKDLAQRTQSASGRRIMVRLVKGAYWDSEIKRAQIEGQIDYPVYTRKVYTDVSYQACAAQLIDAGQLIYPQFATHNAYTLSWVRERARHAGLSESDYEFQCLHGMGETLYDQVVGQGELACRIYAPVGSHETLLAYLVRRLLENGANSSFVNRIVDESVSIAELCSDPLIDAVQLAGSAHPAISSPLRLYPRERRNSLGFDFSNDAELASLATALAPFATYRWSAGTGDGAVDPTHGTPLANPARRADQVGLVHEASSADVNAAIERALAAAPAYAALTGSERAGLLLECADALETNRVELLALAVREAGKTLGNALGEVREAVDFCRYYAQQIARQPALPAAGKPIVCISPWNFPLAIFVGQVSAALACGRAVLAKPAEQTPLMAARAVALMHAAGVPQAILQLLPGPGETIGAQLVADARIGGVLFTGSTDVARLIARQLALRSDETILIAETGGQNAMIVDSSALPEQVVQDVITSAFDSAGQRCSALRVLCLQEDIADTILTMLRGAADELCMGDPARLEIDVGPVIDGVAQAQLESYIERMRARGHRVTRLQMSEAAQQGSFVAPAIIEINALGELDGEVFGPVLHVLRYCEGSLDQLIESINASGYGLTMGIHSRIDEHIARVVGAGHAGNLYVNRNMVGAVVGVQPFGGEGLSGTGPKAGGPLYLARLGGPLGLELKDSTAVVSAEQRNRLEALRAAILATDQLNAIQKEQLFALCETAQQASLASRELELSGPTGETNRLRFVPRGRVACLGGSLADLVAQMIVVLANGGQACGDCTRLPAGLSSLLASWSPQEPVDAACIAPGDGMQSQRRLLTERPGALVPLIVLGFEQAPAAQAWRLLHERTVSTNTAAAGGNASLMALGG